MNSRTATQSPGRRAASEADRTDGASSADGDGKASAGGSTWIVCIGATREVNGGRVSCPRVGAVSAVDCLTCHLLVTVAAERDPRWGCATAEYEDDRT